MHSVPKHELEVSLTNLAEKRLVVSLESTSAEVDNAPKKKEETKQISQGNCMLVIMAHKNGRGSYRGLPSETLEWCEAFPCRNSCSGHSTSVPTNHVAPPADCHESIAGFFSRPCTRQPPDAFFSSLCRGLYLCPSPFALTVEISVASLLEHIKGWCRISRLPPVPGIVCGFFLLSIIEEGCTVLFFLEVVGVSDEDLLEVILVLVVFLAGSTQTNIARGFRSRAKIRAGYIISCLCCNFPDTVRLEQVTSFLAYAVIFLIQLGDSIFCQCCLFFIPYRLEQVTSFLAYAVIFLIQLAPPADCHESIAGFFSRPCTRQPPDAFFSSLCRGLYLCPSPFALTVEISVASLLEHIKGWCRISRLPPVPGIVCGFFLLSIIEEGCTILFFLEAVGVSDEDLLEVILVLVVFLAGSTQTNIARGFRSRAKRDLDDALLGIDNMPSSWTAEEKCRKDCKALSQIHLHLSNQILQDCLKEKYTIFYTRDSLTLDEVYDALLSKEKMDKLVGGSKAKSESLVARGRPHERSSSGDSWSRLKPRNNKNKTC
ncbi:hypothetical protein ZIOFF_028685 [Zingiber officinale]|uniref:Uncharacterized protein n=1 Tax=Zingiber officinale TaxID=94328 RepID=A0A8J5LE05_ZINOF|nr:hypothetical protein ZIOFF_028685 [Zingiber officinale]